MHAQETMVLPHDSVSVVSMKCIFRLWSVSGSVVRLDLLAVRKLFVFLEMSHGGLNLSHERFQHFDSRLDLASASRYIVLDLGEEYARPGG